LGEPSKHEIGDCNGEKFTLSNAMGINIWRHRGRSWYCSIEEKAIRVIG